MNLESIFGSLSRYHVATATVPLPPARVGVDWIWASNGVFKRGINQVLDVLICVAPVQTPGLAQLIPHVRWFTHQQRVPGQLLHATLLHARRAGSGGTIAQPIEQQYHITCEADQLHVRVPTQHATASRVSYAIEDDAPVLLDLHSHHLLPAYFSPTDDADDQGLSVSAVIGRIYDRPEIVVRANVYGHHMRLRALSVFDSLPADLRDLTKEEAYADA